MGIASTPLTSGDLKVAQMRQSHVFENETPFRSFQRAAIRVTKEAGETADHQTVATASFFFASRVGATRRGSILSLGHFG
jgi:hypothetical protein